MKKYLRWYFAAIIIAAWILVLCKEYKDTVQKEYYAEKAEIR